MNETLLPESLTHPMKAGKDSITNPSTASQPTVASHSFDQLFLEHWGWVYRLLLRLVGDPAEAEDLALETFLRLYQRFPARDQEFNLGGWLRRVATNLGLHSIRSYKRRERYELEAGTGVLDEASENRPAEILAGEENKRLVRIVLSEMNPRQAQLLILRYSGMSYKEIAGTLSLNPTSIGPLLLRAEREFEKCFRKINKEES